MNHDSERIAFQQLLILLRVALWEAPISDSLKAADIVWPALLRHAQQQTVAALVADVISRHAARLQPPAEVVAWATRQVAQARQGNLRLNLGVHEVVRHLAQHHIPAVLIKGQGIALSYPQPRLRQCGDIDLYIGATHYEEAVRVMREFTGDSGSFENDKHIHLMYRGLCVELHIKTMLLPMPWQDRDFVRWSQACLESPERPERVPFDDVEVLLPPADYNAVYLLGHAWDHFVRGGVGLRQICDWACNLHLHHAELDPAELRTRLHRYGLWTPWRLWACLAVEHLGLPAAECPGYDPAFSHRASRALVHIIKEGNFGKFDSTRTARPRGYFAGKWHNYAEILKRARRLFSIAPMCTLQAVWGILMSGLRLIIVKDSFGSKPVSLTQDTIENGQKPT